MFSLNVPLVTNYLFGEMNVYSYMLSVILNIAMYVEQEITAKHNGLDWPDIYMFI